MTKFAPHKALKRIMIGPCKVEVVPGGEESWICSLLIITLEPRVE